MRRSIRFLALSLASASVMALAAPAFAESAVPAGYSYDNAQVSDTENDDTLDGTACYSENTGADTAAASGITESEDESDENGPDKNTADKDAIDENAADEDESDKDADGEDVPGKDADEDAGDSDADAEDSSEEADDADEPVCTPYINDKHEKVFTGKYATAYVTADGYSGHIEITDSSIWDTADGLSQIGGYSLSHIIRFKYSGTVENIKLSTDGGIIYDNRISVTGGTDYSHNAYIDFRDETNDLYSMQIYASKTKIHTIDYNSDKPKLKTITWHTQCNDACETIDYDLDTTADWAVPEKGTYYQMEDGWKIYKDEHATAIVPPAPTEDYQTGRIHITDPGFWKNGKALTEINGIPLSEITNAENGYMSSVNTVHDGGIFYDNTLTIKGVHSGGVFSSKPYYKVTCLDKTRDSYSLTICSGDEEEHTVWYNSDSPEIIEIDWTIYRKSN